MKKSIALMTFLIIACTLIVGTPGLGLLKVTVVNSVDQPASNVATYVLDENNDKMVLEATTNESGQFVLQADPGKYNLFVNGEFVQVLDVTTDGEVIVVVEDSILQLGAAGALAGENTALYTGLAIGTVAVGTGTAVGIIAARERDSSED